MYVRIPQSRHQMVTATRSDLRQPDDRTIILIHPVIYGYARS